MDSWEKNHDWDMHDAVGSAAFKIEAYFKNSLLMAFFDDRAKDILAWNIAQHLADGDFSGGHPNYSQAVFSVQWDYLPKSPFGVFGEDVHRHIAGLVQQALYPQDV